MIPAPMIFLHLTDAIDGTPVRIRMDLIEAIYQHLDEQKVMVHPGAPLALAESDSYTMISYAGGQAHGVRETVQDVEGQMADAYELAGIAAAS